MSFLFRLDYLFRLITSAPIKNTITSNIQNTFFLAIYDVFIIY